jgi:hypothetical protein
MKSSEIAALPVGPFFIEKFVPALKGVDFLNLRQVNLDLMAECLPGLNNVTNNVRPYSVMCWAYWKFWKLIEQSGRDDAEPDELARFVEKVESLVIWGHLLESLKGLAGMDSVPPAPGPSGVHLRFRSWGANGRNAKNTSIQAAAQYGPSLLDTYGLGFLCKVRDRFYQTTAAGSQLAEALDRRLQNSPAWPLLNDLSVEYASEADARALFPWWRVDDASIEEQEAFRKVLFSATAANSSSPLGKRSGFIAAVLAVRDAASSPLSTDDFRRALLFRRLSDGTRIQLGEGSDQQCRLWLVLQMRQLQRLAMESLFSWLECQLIDEGVTNPDDLAGAAIAAFFAQTRVSPAATVAETLASLGGPITDRDAWWALAKSAPESADPCAIYEKLPALCRKQLSDVATSAFEVLFLLYRCRGWLQSDDLIASALKRGGSLRVSLAMWFATVERFESRPLRELFDHVLKALILSQHLATGTNRDDGKGLRLRILLDEEGLEALAQRPFRPIVTQDRLEALLSLLRSAGLL